ncbi:Pentatricopeptide repeat-containing protein [Acorus calamus]|uniref:Pentatricopeptide repeat-containing protein n=1 Tax=Acorus calamus TaxID=4465 RepID=A0AAV9DSK1_ACOCL|nr:Pentatricopeptide repeat-containing protein [Acorus calamus]
MKRCSVERALLFRNIKTRTRATTTAPEPNRLTETEALAARIRDILRRDQWRPIIASSDVPTKLNPDAVLSVISSRTDDEVTPNPKRLLDFFYWSRTHMGGVPQKLDSYSILAVRLCDSGLFAPANGLLEQMIKTHFPSSRAGSLLDSISRCYAEVGGSDPVVFDVLINTFKKMGLLAEAAGVVLSMKGSGLSPSLRCCNAMLKDLLRTNSMGLFWEVSEFISGSGLGPDVYTYTTLIGAHCKGGDLDSAKRVFFEMGSKGCKPNEVTYNTLIAGLCKVGMVDEAVEMKREMAQEGLEVDGYTYSSLIEGFMRGGDVEGAFRVRDEMVASGVRPNEFTYNNLIRGVCKMRMVEKAHQLLMRCFTMA